jgi:hypothetical protein
MLCLPHTPGCHLSRSADASPDHSMLAKYSVCAYVTTSQYLLPGVRGWQPCSSTIRMWLHLIAHLAPSLTVTLLALVFGSGHYTPKELVSPGDAPSALLSAQCSCPGGSNLRTCHRLSWYARQHACPGGLRAMASACPEPFTPR